MYRQGFGDILTLNGGNVFNVGIVHRQLIFKDHFLIIDHRFLNFFGPRPNDTFSSAEGNNPFEGDFHVGIVERCTQFLGVVGW